MGLEEWTRDGCRLVPVRRDNMHAAWERNYVFWEIRRWQGERVEDFQFASGHLGVLKGTKYSHKCPA